MVAGIIWYPGFCSPRCQVRPKRSLGIAAHPPDFRYRDATVVVASDLLLQLPLQISTQSTAMAPRRTLPFQEGLRLQRHG